MTIGRTGSAWRLVVMLALLVILLAYLAETKGSAQQAARRLLAVETENLPAPATLFPRDSERLETDLVRIESRIMSLLVNPEGMNRAEITTLRGQLRQLNRRTGTRFEFYVGRLHEVFLTQRLEHIDPVDQGLTPHEQIAWSYFYGRGPGEAIRAIVSAQRQRKGDVFADHGRNHEAFRQLAGGLYVGDRSQHVAFNLRPFDLEGRTVAVLGAGTGQELWPLTQLVGPAGRIVAVDISSQCLDYIDWVRATWAQDTFRTVETHLCREDDTLLPEGTLHVAIGHACPIGPGRWLASLRESLAPGGYVIWMSYGVPEEGVIRSFRAAGFSGPDHFPSAGRGKATLVFRREDQRPSSEVLLPAILESGP